MTAVFEKSCLRKEIRKFALNMSPSETSESDRQIFMNVTSLPEFMGAHTVFCYVGMNYEIATTPLIKYLLSRGTKVAVPLCFSDGVMEARVISSLDELSAGMYGVLEPPANSARAASHEIDFAVVPCVTCDTRLNRLGKGGGYYDRFLRGRSYIAAALCREKLMRERLPAETTDQPVDIVVTETGIYR